MRIAFVPTAYRTPIFHGIARHLEQAGHRVSWLSPNRRWARWLIANGVSSEDVFDVTPWGRSWTKEPRPTEDDLEYLNELEELGTLKVRDIVLMDPLLRRRETDYALRYLAVCARQAELFLRQQRIALLLGEQTWAFELLLGQVSHKLAIRALMPHTVRIPDPRFGFFEGPWEKRLVRLSEAGQEHASRARQHLEDFRGRSPQPAYMAVNRSVLRPNTERIGLLARHVLDLARDPFDETSRRPLGLIGDHCLQLWRKARNSRAAHLSHRDSLPGEPFVYFPLHMEPEASLNIKGSPFTSQVEMIRALSRTLPLTHRLLVKEHGIALTRRTSRFYSDLAEIPGVELVHPDADSFALAAAASLTVTITGTAAYEAALMGRPAATIAPVFFEQIVDFPRFDPFRDRLDEALERTQRRCNDDEIVRFLAEVLANSCPGIVGDALWQPHTMEPAALEEVADGFLAMLEAERSRGTAEPAELA